MMQHILKVSGSNFAATLFDSDDLSTIRGASLAYLEAPRLLAEIVPADWQLEKIYAGASNAIYLVTSDLSSAELSAKVHQCLRGDWDRQPELEENRKLRAVLPHLTFAVAAVAVAGDEITASDYLDAEAQLTAQCRLQQLKRPTVDLLAPPDTKQERCRIDGIRPAAATISVGEGKVAVSASVCARRDWGGAMRNRFYERELDQHQLKLPPLEGVFSKSFHDLTRDPPEGLPVSARNKMAVMYFDGNGFTKKRTAHIQQGDGSPIDRAKGFSDVVANARALWLQAVLTAFSDMAREQSVETVYSIVQDGPDKGGLCLRFETLLWGGDETMVVFPAWMLRTVMDITASHFTDPRWRLDPAQPATALTHALGVVVCDIKTPIRLASWLAKELAEGAKNDSKKDHHPLKGQSAFQYAILESEAVPSDPTRWQNTQYGPGASASCSISLQAGWWELCDSVAAIRDDRQMGRSQIYRLLRQSHGRNDEETEAFVQKRFEEWLAEYGGHTPALLNCYQHNKLGFTSPHQDLSAPLMPFIRIAEWWDYVAPFAREAG